VKLLLAKFLRSPLDPLDVDNDDEDDDAASETKTTESDDSGNGLIQKHREKTTEAKAERKEDLRPMTDLECILAVPRGKGFDLVAKEWCKDLNTCSMATCIAIN